MHYARRDMNTFASAQPRISFRCPDRDFTFQYKKELAAVSMIVRNFGGARWHRLLNDR